MMEHGSAARPQLSLTDEVRFACRPDGRCCIDMLVRMTPDDVWRMVVEESGGVERWGIRRSTDVFGGSSPYAELRMDGIGAFPTAILRKAPVIVDGQDTEACPFLFPMIDATTDRHLRSEDGRPRFVCGIHSARPTVCRSFPFGRILNRAPEQRRLAVRYVDLREGCRGCNPGFDGPDVRAVPMSEWLAQAGVAKAWARADMWAEILEDVGPLHQTWKVVVGVVAFDFDKGWIDAGEEPAPRRAPSFEEHMMRVSRLAAALRSEDYPVARAMLDDFGLRNILG